MNWNAFIACAIIGAGTGAGDTVGRHPAIPAIPVTPAEILRAMDVRVMDPGEVRERLDLRAVA